MPATSIEDLPTVYNAKETEESIYKFWEDNGFFKADAKSPKKPYSIVIPPPNVTGVLQNPNMAKTMPVMMSEIADSFFAPVFIQSLPKKIPPITPTMPAGVAKLRRRLRSSP